MHLYTDMILRVHAVHPEDSCMHAVHPEDSCTHVVHPEDSCMHVVHPEDSCMHVVRFSPPGCLVLGLEWCIQKFTVFYRTVEIW